MKKSLLSISILSFLFQISWAQISYEKININGIKKAMTVNFSTIEDPYEGSLVVIEAPDAIGNSKKAQLAELKKQVAAMYPRKASNKIEGRSVVDPPRVIKSWYGNNSSVGTPLDTHLAISNDGQVISTINSHIAIFDTEGVKINSFTMAAFTLGLDVAANRFDPRIYYDPEQDKFILVFLAGSESSQTNAVVGFSATNDAAGDWNIYVLDGNPDDLKLWTDFPMITITPEHFLLTVNLIRDNEPWQTGFDETLIWKMDKMAGYAGADINSTVLRDVFYEGKSVRNMCPVKSATGAFSNINYFMSNRNFDLENDTFFLAGFNVETEELSFEVLKSPTLYGAPPHAMQISGMLQTNDARVLDAFILEDQIHFVGNTRNLETNGSGIYHGIISDVGAVNDIDIQHIIGPDFEIGYPGISYAGTPGSEEGAMINFSHTSTSRFPGQSALWYDFAAAEHSEIITIREGEKIIDMIGNPVDRWGDYAGTQRKYNDPETVWVNGSIGYGNNNWNVPWVASLATPSGVLPTEDLPQHLNTKVFPNPINDFFSIEFEVPNNTKDLMVELFDMSGMMIDRLYKGAPRKAGKSVYRFSNQSLQSGTYVVKVTIDGATVNTKKMVVQK